MLDLPENQVGVTTTFDVVYIHGGKSVGQSIYARQARGCLKML